MAGFNTISLKLKEMYQVHYEIKSGSFLAVHMPIAFALIWLFSNVSFTGLSFLSMNFKTLKFV